MAAAPLRVALVTTFYPPCNFGGDGRYVRSFAHALARRGIEVEVIYDADAWRAVSGTPQSAQLPEPLTEPAGVTVHRLESDWALGSTLLTQQLGRPVLQSRNIERLLARGFDVIHYHNISLVGGPAVLSLGEAVKLYTAHEHWLVCPNHVLWRYNRELCDARDCVRCSLAFRRPPQLWRSGSMLDNQARHVDAFIALSESVARNHKAFGFAREMVPMASFMPDDASLALGEGAPRIQERPYFLFVGRLEVIKGLQDVIPCFDDDSPADLLIAGTGEFEERLHHLAEGRRCVRFLGQQLPEALPGLYRNAVALIAASLCYEVFPMVALEAFREATPLIARDLGPYRQILEESGGGLLFEDAAGLKAAMRRLVEDPALRDRLGAAGRRAVETRWSERTAIDAWLGLVRDIATAKGRTQTARGAEALLPQSPVLEAAAG